MGSIANSNNVKLLNQIEISHGIREIDTNCSLQWRRIIEETAFKKSIKEEVIWENY